MSRLRQQAKIQLATELERQGARVKMTKSGYLAFTPLGTMGWHRSASSDTNGDRNLRKDIERLGLTWPFGK